MQHARKQLMSGANGRGPSPLITGQPKYLVQPIKAENVQPAITTMQTPAGAQTFIVGGLSKLEHFALELAKAHPEAEESYIVDRAALLLELCDTLADTELEPAAESNDAEPEQPGIVLP